MRVATILGTRPEVIKMAPVIHLLSRTAGVEHVLVTTAQHREMLDQILRAFDLKPDVDLGLMRRGQTLAGFAARALSAVATSLAELRPALVLIQGDTTTVMVAALAAFYAGIRVGHVEAGLRSFDRANPFPEEINRKLTTSLATLHFAPTERAGRNLRREGVPREHVFVTGNTIVDALRSLPVPARFESPQLRSLELRRRVILVTAHRRENVGEPLRRICAGVRMLAERFDDVEIVYPVHLNPAVRSIVRAELARWPRVRLVDPVSYGDLLRLMAHCHLILTDSGGIQEEAPSFHKPVLILREVTERPEAVEGGGATLVGTDTARIVKAATRLLGDAKAYRRMSMVRNPFGDGRAAERIVRVLGKRLAVADVRVRRAAGVRDRRRN